jgi:flagellar protein FliO/FliZ
MDWTDYARFILALIFVIALMGGLYMVLRHFASSGTFGSLKLSNTRRLKIIEVLPIDSRYKAILLKRDDETEHLIILGQTNALTVETKTINPQTNGTAS